MEGLNNDCARSLDKQIVPWSRQTCKLSQHLAKHAISLRRRRPSFGFHSKMVAIFHERSKLTCNGVSRRLDRQQLRKIIGDGRFIQGLEAMPWCWYMVSSTFTLTLNEA
ncbi:unnamed protein product [Leptosia nina]|uniref:Uncharacterized protein n=1 Tax=Leptosia nina TaxID=320188 RepID=A0AAV1JCH9_9NEOP